MKKKDFNLLILIFINLPILSCDVCQITEISQSPYTNGVLNPTSIKYSPNGSCLAITNMTNNTLSIYSVNEMTCELTLVGSPVPTGGIGAISLSFSPDNRCIAVAHQTSSDISIFSINPETCQATLLQSGIPSGGTGATAIAYSPTGSCLAVVNQFTGPFGFGNGNVNIFSVNQETCLITQIGAPISIGAINPVNVSYSPNGTCLAIANFDVATSIGSVSIYSVNQETCQLTFVNSMPTGGFNSTSVNFSPSGTCLAIANSSIINPDPGSISIFSVDPATCQIAQIGGPISTGGQKPISLVYSQDNRCLAVANNFSNDISIFAVNSDCTLTLIATPTPVGAFPRLESYSPDNTCFAVANSDFDPTGQTPPVGPGSISVFKTNFSVVPTLASVSTDCSGRLTIVGSNTAANATVVVFANSTNIGTGTADSTGNFNFTIPTSLSDDTYSITVTQNAAGSCPSNPSNAINITIDKAQTPILSSVSSNCLDGLIIVGSNADANATITVFANSINIGSGTANSLGNFNFTVPITLTDGTYSIRVQQINVSGCTSNLSNDINFRKLKFDNLSRAICLKYGCNS